eukprot:scaffold39105_cov59-Cyclotella_meneghiniana.AAC.7
MEIDINESKFVGESVEERASPIEIRLGIISSATLEQSTLRTGCKPKHRGGLSILAFYIWRRWAHLPFCGSHNW